MYVEAYETSSSFYNSQLYKVFVICDVCNRSLCVIPFDFIKPDNINILHELKNLSTWSVFSPSPTLLTRASQFMSTKINLKALKRICFHHSETGYLRLYGK